MTTTIKFDAIKLLSELASSQSSGCLEINGESVLWKIYLHKGSIKYGTCSIQSMDQLKYHLHYLQCKQSIAALKNLPPSQLNHIDSSSGYKLYDRTIGWLIKNEYLELTQALQLIKNISMDEIISCLWLDSAVHSWNEEQSLPLWITNQIKDSLSLSVSECLDEAKTRKSHWQNCSKKLFSVFQRPYFPPGWESKNMPQSGSLNHDTLKQLTQVLTGRTSIRQLSILLKKSEFQVAKILSPYIDQKIIYLRHAADPLSKLPQIPREDTQFQPEKMLFDGEQKGFQNKPNLALTKTWKIVCIDDSPTILSEIKRFLDKEQLEITAIDDPVQAVSQVFTIKPDLILLDITMPRINGYKLCGLLRNSGKCDSVPIIMVTGNTGLIDKARAKLSGSTDYLTKPFTKEILNRTIRKYLPI